jgi:hypothetical protein
MGDFDMEYPRRIALIFLIFLCMLPSLLQAGPIRGIALVHGTNDHRDDAFGGYWKTDFIEQIGQSVGGMQKVLVVRCDFSHYMWAEEASGCLADQVLRFVAAQEIDELIVYTHSDGANITRFILSQPTYDPRFLELSKVVKEVIALAPSSGGTPLADEVISGGVFEAGLGWLLGYQNDAVRQQRLGDMARFNEEILLASSGQPNLMVPFRTVIGTNVAASPINSASYCNGYLLNSALKVSKIYLDYCSDGFLNCSSQEAAGTLWFRDFEQTDNGETLSHNQSRHDCFGLVDIFNRHLQQEESVA